MLLLTRQNQTDWLHLDVLKEREWKDVFNGKTRLDMSLLSINDAKTRSHWFQMCRFMRKKSCTYESSSASSNRTTIYVLFHHHCGALPFSYYPRISPGPVRRLSYHPMIILAERCLFLSFCCHCSWSRFSALTLHHNPPPTATNVKAMAPLGDLPLEAEYRAPSQWSIIIDRINTSVFYQKVSAFLITCGVFPDWNGSFYESKKFRDWRKRREYERQQSEEVVSQWATVVLGKY